MLQLSNLYEERHRKRGRNLPKGAGETSQKTRAKPPKRRGGNLLLNIQNNKARVKPPTKGRPKSPFRQKARMKPPSKKAAKIEILAVFTPGLFRARVKPSGQLCCFQNGSVLLAF